MHMLYSVVIIVQFISTTVMQCRSAWRLYDIE